MGLWKKLFVGILVLSLILVAGLALFVSLVDPNEYRGAIADLVEELTGRDLEITGDLHLKLLPAPSVEAHGLSFSNASWASEPYMVRAKSARAELALGPLLKGRLVVHRAVAVEPEVFLEVGADGRSNWIFDTPGDSAGESEVDKGASVPGIDVIVRELHIEDGSLDFVDEPAGAGIRVAIGKLTIGSERPGGRMQLSMKGVYQELPVALEGRLGAPGAILRNQPVEVDLEGSAGDAEFTVQGAVGKPLEGKDLRLEVKVDAKASRPLTELAGVDVEEVGPLRLTLTLVEKDGRVDLEAIDGTARLRNADVAVTGSVANVLDDPKPDVEVALSADTLRQLDPSLPEAGPVKVSANVRPRDRVIEIHDLVASVGKSDLSGNVMVDTGGGRPNAAAKLHARVLDVAELVPEATTPDAPAAADKPAATSESTRDRSEVAVEAQPTGKKVFSDAPLPLDVLKKANGSIELVVDKLVTRTLTLDKVDLAATLDDGSLSVRPAAHVAGGKIAGIIDIDARSQPAKFSADVDAKKVSIGALTKEIRGYETSRGLDSDLAVKLRGQGESLHDVVSGLNGDLRLEIGEGRLNNDVLDRVGADLLTQIIGIAVPKDAGDETTKLECGVLRFAVVDGEAIADQTIVLETDKVLLKGGGLVDLETEELDLGAKLAARKGIRIGSGTLSSLARLQGTLAEPELGTDLTGVVKTGAKVGIAFVTVGLSLVAEGVYGHLSEDEHPCQTALARQMEVTPKEYKDQKTAEEN
jgi:uncharacterized protein involved in outer membrane biogenesis